ncbi:MAG: restriction endonuclease [Sphingopyxis sp.]|nr:restriction endonuclease [Sphingopyxis sp.]
MEAPILDRISSLSPSEFENLTYDCARASGLKNLVWRTPGADGGRDIEGVAYVRDITGFETVQRWYIECKRYASSVDWPTLYAKIAFADAHAADVLLLSTNSNPSPACESQITTWNEQKRRPAIRVWRGYELTNLIRGFSHIGVAYGLIDEPDRQQAALLPLSFLISKIVQGAYVATAFDSDPSSALETASALSELLSQRLADVEQYGRLTRGAESSRPPNFDWLSVTGDMQNWEDVSVRSALSFIKHQTGSKSVTADFSGSQVSLTLGDRRFPATSQSEKDLLTVCHWTALEILENDALNFSLRQRAGDGI